MPNGFGGGRTMGRGLVGGRGFGFRGSSPPWPYVGIGRGGLPRCSYFTSGASAVPAWPCRTPGYANTATPLTEDEELSILKNEEEAIKGQLGNIEARMRDLEGK